MTAPARRPLVTTLGVVLCLFTVVEVNYPLLAPQSRLAIFAGLGLTLCFLEFPLDRRLAAHPAVRVLDGLLAAAAALICAYVVIQTEPVFSRLWADAASLGDRAGQETPVDVVVGLCGLALVLEATRRSIGWALPALATLFLAYAYFGASLPGWLFPHRGYGMERIVAQTFLHSQGVFGTALRVMCVYVFLFVLFGALLEKTGATRFIIDFSQRVFGRSPGSPAKVAVLSSGLMGSLSGSAVANTATTGTFTIPLMRSAGFSREIAAGVEAAASSGGALVPPVMGAGAYMMLEIVDPPVTYLEIIRAAIIPAVLYYFSLLLIVHLHARKIGLRRQERPSNDGSRSLLEFEGFVFLAGIGSLIASLLYGTSPFRAATISLFVVLLVGLAHPRTRPGPAAILDALTRSARNAVPLVSAAACVGVVIGVVTLTGIGTKLPASILGLSQGNLLAALVLIMVSSIVLGMGLPSAVCYLLMATLVGPVLSKLGVVPLAAHLFIFYFGMMSMVTPPVALAAYAAASIAGSKVMVTGFAAFRFALVGFTLPYMFVLRPELLMLDADGGTVHWAAVLRAVVLAVAGIVPLAAAITGQLFRGATLAQRVLLFGAAVLLLIPTDQLVAGFAGVPVSAVAGGVLLLVVGAVNRRTASRTV